MGVDARLVVYAPDKETAETACKAAFDRIAALDTIMSDYRIDSELNNLSNGSGGPAIRVSADLFKVLERSLEMSRRTNGAFDVTVGPLISLWRKARKTSILPTFDEIKAAKSKIGWRKVVLNAKDQTARLTTPGMKLDLGGIAKGFADDEAQIVLKRYGIKSALVEMGGDIVVSSPPPGKKGWTIQIPNAENGAGPVDIEYTNCAISCSGDTEQNVVIGGKQYSHVVDPTTGMALTNRVQATVIAPNGLISDPLSTAITLVKPNDRKKLLESYPGTQCFVKVLPFKINTRASD